MLKSGAWLLTPLLFLPTCFLDAQVIPDPGESPMDAQVLPDLGESPIVDTITPVPAPKFPFGGGFEGIVMPEELKLDNQGGKIEGNLETGVRFGGPVKIEGDNGLEVFSDTAVLDLKAKTVTLVGHVRVYQGNILQRGDRAVYFYERKFLDNSGLRVVIDSVVLQAGKYSLEDRGGQHVFIGEDVAVATNDVEDPNYWVRAKKATVFQGDKIVFENLRVYAGDVPVLWLPYLSQTLDPDLGYHFLPGSRPNWGPYLLNSYGMMLGGDKDPMTGEGEDGWLLSTLRFDIRANHGIGGGVDFEDTRAEELDSVNGLSLYFLHDTNPDTSYTGVERKNVDPDRYRLQLKHRIEPDLPDDADWRIDSNLTWLSDQYYLRDFEPYRYRTEPTPDNTLGLYRRDDETLFSVFGRFRVNDFYRADTQGPEIALDQARRPFFGTPLLHEGQTSFSFRGVEAGDFIRKNTIDPLLALPPGDPLAPGLLNQLNGYERTLAQQIRSLQAVNPADPRIASLRTQLLDTGFNRFHTNHTFSLPITYGDWFTLTPRIGAAYTHYSSVQGPADSDARFMLHGGAEAAVKISKDYGNLRSDRWGIDGLLHILQPYANWSVIGVDELDQDYPKIDRLTFTTRPRPLDPSRYTAIDEFESWNILRLGARNHIITHRDGQSYEWLYMDTYIDKYIDDPEGSREWSNLYNDIRWQPLPWLGADLETQFPLLSGGSGFSEISTRLRFMPYQDMSLSLGYRQLNSHPVLQDSNRIELGTYMRLAENWGVGTLHIFQMDDGTLEAQQYTLHHDFGDWVAVVGVTHRDNRFEDEFGVIFSLTLKGFPSASLPFALDAQ